LPTPVSPKSNTFISVISGSYGRFNDGSGEGSRNRFGRDVSGDEVPFSLVDNISGGVNGLSGCSVIRNEDSDDRFEVDGADFVRGDRGSVSK
jgi:hypothetical protein